jgi:DeoR family fructose operon transcriptional repressor
MKARYEAILKILKYSNQEVKVDELSSQLGVSAVTIRRDLEQLEKEDVLIRTHGGAITKSGNIPSPTLRRKMKANLKEKKEIARAALKLIDDHETIILCDGTTTYQICLLLKESLLELRVITNDLNIALELTGVKQIEVVVIGGKMTGHYSIGGYLGEKVVEYIHSNSSSIDKAFIGADAINLQDGLTAFGMGDVNILNVMAKVAKEVIAVVDHTKFGNAKFIPLLPLQQVDTIITDSGIPEPEVEAYRSKGVSIIVAEPLTELS